jgi:hypothetical protein
VCLRKFGQFHEPESKPKQHHQTQPWASEFAAVSGRGLSVHTGQQLPRVFAERARSRTQVREVWTHLNFFCVSWFLWFNIFHETNSYCAPVYGPVLPRHVRTLLVTSLLERSNFSSSFSIPTL